MTIVMGVLIMAFALWGVGDYFTQSSNDSVATVNGENITISEFNTAFNNYRQRMMAQFGENMDPSYFDSPMMRRGELDRMINTELSKQMAIDTGYRVTAEDIKTYIEEVPNFQNENGEFDKTLYAAFLSQTNQSAQALQQQIVESQASAAIFNVVSESSVLTPLEAKKMAMLNKQSRDIEYVTIATEPFKADMEVTEEEIESHYQANSAQYMTEEMVSVNYLELDAEEVANNIDVSEEAALEYYEDNKDGYRKPEQRKAAHILVTGDDADEKIADIQARLAAGESFAELAKAESEDPGSASQGGDLGWVSPGDMVEAFDEALFDMETGAVSDPVETEFGVHLIQLDEVRDAGIEPFEAVKADIVQALQATDSETLFLEQANAISEAVLDAQSGLESAAENTGVELKTTELFGRSGGEGIASNREFINAAFSSTVKEQMLNSGVINLSDTHVAFIHINEIKPAEVKPLEEVREAIVAELTNLKAETAAKTLAETITTQVNEGNQTLAELATEQGLELQTATEVTRTGSSLPFNLVQDVFALPRPAGESVQAQVMKGNGNDAVVLKLLAVNDVDTEALGDLSAETAQITRNIKNNEQQLLIQAMREQADITINETLLNSVQ